LASVASNPSFSDWWQRRIRNGTMSHRVTLVKLETSRRDGDGVRCPIERP
jgi:hypothetical protein